MAYTVEVYNDSYITEYTESFDAPDWQTALIAAAELAKIDDRGSASDCGDLSPCGRSGHLDCVEPNSACDLGDERDPNCACIWSPVSGRKVCKHCADNYGE